MGGGSVDRPPDLVADLRAMKARLTDIEGRLLNRVVAAARVTVVGTSAANGSSLITFDTLDFDSGGMWNAGAPTRLTIPTTGVYSVSGSIQFATNATGIRGALIQHNGVDLLYSETRVQAITSASYTQVPAYSLVECVAGDYVELDANQTSGGPLSVTLAALSAHFIGVLV